MFDFHLTLRNPFHAEDREWVDFFCKEWMITKNKFIETQLSKCNFDTIFRIDFELNFNGQHHAGIGFSVRVFSLFFTLMLRDRRHWDYEEGKWEEHE